MAGSEDRKQELSRELAQARQSVQVHGRAVRHALDVPARIRHGFQKNAVLWIGGAIVLGFLLSKIPPRTKKVRVNVKGDKVDAAEIGKSAGLMGVLIAGAKIAFDLLRPVLLRWAASRVQPMAERWMERYHTDSEDPRG